MAGGLHRLAEEGALGLVYVDRSQVGELRVVLDAFGQHFEEHDPDDDFCRCQRAMIGLDTWEETTTVVVVDVDMTLEDLEERVVEGQSSWLTSRVPNGCADLVARMVVDLVMAATAHPVGTIVERRG